MKLFYSPAYVGAVYAFETTRKAEWIVDSLRRTPIDAIELLEPEPLTFKRCVRFMRRNTSRPYIPVGRLSVAGTKVQALFANPVFP